MVLQILISFTYELVRQSWFFAAFVLKFLVAAVIIRLYIDGRLGLESLQQELLDYSRETVTGIVAVGLVLVLTGFELPVYFQLVSELIALAYFGFLFWKY